MIKFFKEFEHVFLASKTLLRNPLRCAIDAEHSRRRQCPFLFAKMSICLPLKQITATEDFISLIVCVINPR